MDSNFKNFIEDKPSALSDDYYGKFIRLCLLMSDRNILEHKANAKPINNYTLMGYLNIKGTAFNSFLRKLREYNMISKVRFKDYKYIAINPKYAKSKEFELILEILNEFKDDIILNYTNYYRFIKSKECSDCFINLIEDEVIKSYLNFEFSNESYRVSNELINKGIYILYDNYNIVYVGKSLSSIENRIKSHNKDKLFNSVKYIEFKSDSDIDLYEVYLINKYKPIYNKEFVRGCDGLTLPEIKGI